MLPRANAYAMIRRRAAGAQARQQQLPGDRDHRLLLCETQMPKPLTSVSEKARSRVRAQGLHQGPRHWPVNDRWALDDDYRLSVPWQTATLVGRRRAISRRGSGGPTWSVSSWRSTISGAAICSPDNCKRQSRGPAGVNTGQIPPTSVAEDFVTLRALHPILTYTHPPSETAGLVSRSWGGQSGRVLMNPRAPG